MSLDKFGRSTLTRSGGGEINSSQLLSPSRRRGFIFTEDGNIDIEKLKLCNVNSPTEDGDAVNKKYVDEHISTVISEFSSFRKDTNNRLNKYKVFTADIKNSIKKLETYVLKMEKSNSSNDTTLSSSAKSTHNDDSQLEHNYI